jgi:hypothetical protein
VTGVRTPFPAHLSGGASGTVNGTVISMSTAATT